MYKVIFYEDANGKQPVKEYLIELSKAKDRKSRVQLNRIARFIDRLESEGTRIGMPYVRKLDEGLWELRPDADRIFFFAYDGVEFILLHHYRKASQKMPKHEFETALKRMKDYTKRRKYHV